MGSRKGFGWAWGVGFVRFACPAPSNLPTFVSVMREKSRLDRPADRYRSALDGFRGSDSMFQTVTEGLRVCLENALSVYT